MNKPAVIVVIAIVCLAGIVVLSGSVYTVDERKQVLITQFGKLKGEPVTEAGLHKKIPFVQDIHRLEKRALEWDGDVEAIQTKDKLFVEVDTFARWRIADPVLYYESLRDEDSARTRLDDVLDGLTRDVIASHNLIEIIRSENREVALDVTTVTVAVGNLEKISIGRSRIMREIFEKASAQLDNLGIELLDIRLKRINYNREVQERIFDRMISERAQIAEEFRSEGRGSSAKIIGEKERDLKEIESVAYKTIQETKGDADAKAIRIYADAYNQSPEAYDFYRFLKTMETYNNTLGADTTAILSTDGEFFRFLRGSESIQSAP